MTRIETPQLNLLDASPMDKTTLESSHHHQCSSTPHNLPQEAPFFSLTTESVIELPPPQVTFWQDFVAGGIAGSASVVVGHPFDTIKVRLQTLTRTTTAASTIRDNRRDVASLWNWLLRNNHNPTVSKQQPSLAASSSRVVTGGGPSSSSLSSLFRGLGTPLASAAALNALVFSSYGAASKVYDSLVSRSLFGSPPQPAAATLEQPQLLVGRDSWYKSMTCGAFAGMVQCIIIVPMEHVKCRLQASSYYRGPMHAIRSIVHNHGGVWRLYQGWGSSLWREVPAFAVYFSSYDFLKEQVVATSLVSPPRHTARSSSTSASPSWFASALAGGLAGALTWALVYPVDVIKTRIQTTPLDTPQHTLTVWRVGRQLVHQHGWRFLFRGFSMALLRAVPVNATLFPIYESTLQLLQQQEQEGQYPVHYSPLTQPQNHAHHHHCT